MEARTRTRWADSATASSENPSYGPVVRATGAPDSGIWMPLRSNSRPQWIEVAYAEAARANGLRIHEVSRSPSVVRVDLLEESGASHTVFDGGDQTKDGGWLALSFGTTPYKVKKARVWTVPAAAPSGASPETIDAIGLDAVGVDDSEYNAFNQLTRVTGSDGGTTAFGYDGNGNQVTKVEGAGATAMRTTYTYDPDNRLRRVTQGRVATPATAQWATTATSSTQYTATTQSAAQATGAADTAGCGLKATAWSPSSSGAAVEWLELGYAVPVRASGVRVHETNGTPFVVEAIDAGGAAHTVWQGADTTACGGWLEVGFPATGYDVTAVKLTTAATGYEQVDAAELVTAPVYAADAVLGEYEYDANGLRVARSDSSGSRSYLLDGLSIAAEYSSPGVREAWYTQSLARIDEPLSVVNGQAKYWYQADALGSVYALTTSTGAVQARGGYDVFGAPVAAGGTAVGQPFGFTGREHEAESGMVYSRNRFLASDLGRFMSPDIDPESVSKSGGAKLQTGLTRMYGGFVPFVTPGMGLFQYADGNPAIGRDPTGFALEMVNRGSVIYTGFSYSNPWWPGSAASLGSAFGFFGETGQFGGMSSALALTWGVAFHPSLKIGVSVGVEFGIYWGLRNACDYEGPFANFGLDLGLVSAAVEGIGVTPVFSVSPEALRAAGSTKELLAAASGPVGLSFSFSSPRLTKAIEVGSEGLLVGSSLSAMYTFSELYQKWGCQCQ